MGQPLGSNENSFVSWKGTSPWQSQRLDVNEERGKPSRSETMPALAIVLTASLLGMSGCSACAFFSDSTPADDAQKLQGTWRLAGATYDGESIFDDVRLTFDGDQYIVKVHGVQEKSQFKLGTGGRNTIWVKHHDNPVRVSMVG